MIKHSNLFIIGIALTIIGMAVIIGPEAFVVTPAQAIVFDGIGQVQVGILVLLAGAWSAFEGWRGSKRFFGTFLGVFTALFWFVVNLLPIWYGDAPVSLFGATITGQLSGTTLVAWGLITVLLGKEYIEKRFQARLT